MRFKSGCGKKKFAHGENTVGGMSQYITSQGDEMGC